MEFYLKRKEKVILTAIEIIDELGFKGLSTKEICKRQQISEGTLYKHFRSKEEIITAVLDYYTKYDDMINQSIEMSDFSGKESIMFFLSKFAEYYESYPAMTAILNSYEFLRHEMNDEQLMVNIFTQRMNSIKKCVDKGVREGEFKNERDSEVLTNIIVGTFNYITLSWRMQKYNFSLKDRVKSAIESIMKVY